MCPTEILSYISTSSLISTQLNHTTKYLSSMHVPLFWLNIVLRSFCTIIAASRKKEGTIPYSYRIASRVFYSAQSHRHKCTLQAFEQFGALYMCNLDDKHPNRPGFEPSNGPRRILPAEICSCRLLMWCVGLQTHCSLIIRWWELPCSAVDQTWQRCLSHLRRSRRGA